MFHFDINAGVIIPVVFWLFVAAVSITPIIATYKVRKATMDTIRAAIEKGHDLSPDMVKNLSGIGNGLNGLHNQRVQAVQLKIAGVIVLGTGVGAAGVATAFLLTPSVSVAAPFIYAGASLVSFVGIGLYFASGILKQHEQEQKASGLVE